MAVDIASLGIRIDIQGGQQAGQSLDDLSNAADRASRSADNLGRRGQNTTRNLVALERSSNSLTSSLAEATRKLLGFNTATNRLGSQLTYIDERLNIVGHAATETGAAFQRIVNPSTLGQLNRISSIFQDAGVAINGNSRQLQQLAQQMQRVSQQRAFQNLAQEANLSNLQLARLRASMGDFSGAFSSLTQASLAAKAGIAGAALAVGAFAKSCIEAQESLNRLNLAYEAVFGARAQSELAQIYQQADRLGLKFVETAEAAKGFFAAGQGTTLQKDMQDIFKAFTDAGAALQLSTDEMSGALLALGQMISKGKVQAEELRGQLGERLPGAFRIAAEAMGMTTAELDKFMADGNLVAEDLLPKMAAALEEKFGESAVKAANTFTGATNRTMNEWERFKASILDSGPMVAAINSVTNALRGYNNMLQKNAEYDKAAKELGAMGIQPAGKRINPLANVFDIMAGELKEERYYTAEQLKIIEDRNKEAAKINAEYTDILQKEEKVLAERREKIAAAMKGTAEEKRKNLQSELDDLRAKQAEYRKIIENDPSQQFQVEKNGQKIWVSRAEFIAQSERETQEAIDATTEKLAKMDKAASKAGKSAGAAATKAAVSQADYTGELERTQQKIESLQAQLGLDKTETLTAQKIKIEEQYQRTISKTNEELAKQVARGSLSQQQADALKVEKEKEASLTKQLAIKQAEQKQDQKNVQLAQGQVKFYKELGQLSGNYGKSIELQNQLIAKQADEYRNTYHIAAEFVDEWERLQQLQISQDPFDGAYRGLLRFTSEFSDQAKQWESATYDFAKSFMSQTRNMFDEFIETGKVSLNSFSGFFKQFLKDLAWQALAQPIILSVIGGVAGAAGAVSGAGGGATAQGGGSSPVSSALGAGNQMLQNYATKQLFSGMGGSGGIAGMINNAVASMFPSSFAASTTEAAINSSISDAFSTVGMSTSLPTQTFTQAAGSFLGNFAGGGLGAGIGSVASPFVNSLLGLQNNQGASTGSMLGGLAGTGLAGGLALAGAIPGFGWAAAALGALGSILGGGIGSLFGGQQEEPELYFGANANLWRKPEELKRQDVGGSVKFLAGEHSGVWATADQGASWQTANATAEYMKSIVENAQNVSWAINESLGMIDESLSSQYIENLKKAGDVGLQGYLSGKIDQKSIQDWVDGFGKRMQKAMLDSLSDIDLTPLTIAADGMAADTAKELGEAVGKIISYVNISANIDDEEMRQKFAEGVIPKMQAALNNVSLEPLTNAADGLAVRTVDQLSKSMEEIFSVYDVSESIADENIKKAFQDWAQNAITSAFSNVDLSFLRVDFDKSSFGGLQQAYAAIQAWNAVEEGINAVLKPANEFDTAMNAASAQFDQWIQNLRQLGWQEQAIAEVEARRASYMGELRRQMESEMQQNLSLRLTALRYGSDSYQYGAKNLRFQQANELESVAQKFGSNSLIYRATQKAQAAEYTKFQIDFYKQQRQQLQQREIQAQQKQIQQRQQALQKELAARQKELSEASRVAEQFKRVVKQLEDFRRDLWTSQNNLTGSRYNDAYAQFNELYEKALAGDEDAYEQLTGKANDLLTLARENLGGRDDYTDLFYEVDQKLKLAQESAQRQLTEAEKQVAAIEAQIAALERQQEALNAQLEELQKQSEQLQLEYEQGEVANMSLQDIDANIANLELVLQQQTEELATAYQTAFGVDWEKLFTDVLAARNEDPQANATRDKLLQEISEKGMTPAEWYVEIGKVEGYTLTAAETTNNTIDREIGNLDYSIEKNLEKNTIFLNETLTTQLTELYAQGVTLNSLALTQAQNWPVQFSTMNANTNTLVGAINNAANKIAGAVQSAIAQATAAANAAAAAANAAASAANKNTATSKTTTTSRTTTTKKYAAGGITPINEAFIVGENGPELLVSSSRYGVLSNAATQALLQSDNPALPMIAEREDGSEEQLGEIAGLLSVLISYMQQDVAKNDDTAYLMRQVRNLAMNWDADRAMEVARA